MNKKIEKVLSSSLTISLAAGVTGIIPMTAGAATLTSTQKYNAAVAAVNKAKATPTQANVNSAKKAIAALKGTSKASKMAALTTSVNTVQAQVLAIAKVVAAITTATNTLTQANIDAAKVVLASVSIPTSYKTAYKNSIASLEAKLAENIAEAAAEKATAKAEASKETADIVLAMLAVSSVKDSVKAAAFKERLGNIDTASSATTASALTTTIDSAVTGYSDTVLIKENGYNQGVIEAKVTDKNGKGIAGVTVVFTGTDSVGDTSLANGAGKAYVATTDRYGVATCIAQTYSWKQNDVGSIKYTATVVGKDISASGIIKFARISLGNLTNVNSHNDDVKIPASLADNLVPATNATYLKDPAMTFNMNGGLVEYVASQQVSKTGESAHAVTFSATPKLLLPAVYGTAVSGTYKQDINESSGAYHPYATWTKSYTVPAGLKYATLNLGKLQIAPNSKFTVDVIDKDNNVTNVYKVLGKNDTSNIGVQIPIQYEDAAQTVRVTLQSPGNVQTDLNGGVSITSITGVYKNEPLTAGSTVDLPGATIKWESAAVTYTNPVVLNNAADYIPASQGYNQNYTYSYQVPVFPLTGNAIIVGKNANGEIKEYYVFPTINNGANQNVLANHFTNKAILVTEKEAKSQVGTITQNGNDVTVNSSEVGFTALKGTLSIPGVSATVLDATNSTLYTSVQWAPLQTSTVVVPNKKAYALVGQNITVTAQLVDANNNPVAQNNVAVNWSYTNDSSKPATEIQKDNITDTKGQAKFVITDGESAKLTGLTAKAPAGYNIVLKIGNDVVTAADLYWISAGLSYVRDFNSPIDQAASGEIKNAITNSADAGKTTEYGYQLTGKDKDGNTVIISGVPVKFTKTSGVGTMSVTGDTSFVAASNATGVLNVKGEIGTMSSNVTFTYVDKNGISTVYNNAGTGATSMFSTLNLPINFGSVGQQVSFVNPYGTNIAGTATTVYAKLTDSLGNPITGSVIVTLNNIPVTVNSDKDGIVKIDMTKGATSTSVVKVQYGDNIISETINWTTPSLVHFEAVNASLDASKANDVIALKFTGDIDPASVISGEFAITAGTAAYEIKDAKVSGDTIYLTLADSNAKLPQTVKTTYTVSINPAKATNGITYSVADNFGRTIAQNSQMSFTVPSASAITASLNGKTLTVNPTEASVAANGKVTLVSSDLNAFQNNGDGTETVTISGGSNTIALYEAVVGTTINLYYNGKEFTVIIK